MIISDLTYLEAASDETSIVGGKHCSRPKKNKGGGKRGGGGNRGGGSGVNRSIIASQEANVTQTNVALGGDSVLGAGGPAIVALNFATSQPDQVLINNALND